MGAIDEVIEKWKKTHHPVYDFKATDGVSHTIWILNDDTTITLISELFKNQVPVTYIADGHHRAASAAKVRKALGDKATEGSNYFLTTLFPSDQLQIMDYNRVVKDLNGLSEEEFISRLSDDFLVQKSVTPVSPPKLHEFGVYINKQWFLLEAKEGTYSDDPIGVLDVTILQNNILDKLLGIKDQRPYNWMLRGVGRLSG